ncbi:DUF3288 family protein [Lusitaniella coriacea]|uniref:DUF3288 family protein n=1 Tax=Lusitaniella coriacea TaxID=1983105 RepID=UPI003CE7BCEA
MAIQQNQKHPQEKNDRATVDLLLQEGRSDYNLAELARLRIRYRGFPGAKEIQQDLDRLLQEWQLQEEELFTLTRQLHESGDLYRRGRSGEQEDWS